MFTAVPYDAPLLFGLAALCITLPSSADDAASPLAPLLDPVSGIQAPWQVHGLPHQSKPYTQFVPDEVEGVRALRIESDRGYGNLVHRLNDLNDMHHLAWRWRLDTPNREGDLRVRALEDTPLRVCALFDLPLSSVPLRERPLLLITRAASEHPVPAAVVCYVWDSRLDPGSVVESPYTRRVRMIVLRGPDAPLQQWTTEARDIGADFMQLFGAESAQVPPLVGVLVGADADNTQQRSVAHVTQVLLTR